MATEHYTTALPAIIGPISLEERKRRVAERDAGYTKLKAAGYKQSYYGFEKGNAASEIQAKRLARADANRWLLVTGVKLKVMRGAFL